MKPLFIITLFLLTGHLSFAQNSRADLMITGGNIIDIKTGKITSGKAIIIRNDSIIIIIDSKKKLLPMQLNKPMMQQENSLFPDFGICICTLEEEIL
ncbi:hypothetical protein [Pedobacter sp. NJ-S-72]